MKVELANDIIARKVYESASIDDKARAIASKFIQERYTHFCRSKNMLLSTQELAFVQPYLNQLVLGEKQEQYIERSRQKIQNKKRRRRLRDASIVALFCVLILSSWGIWERQRYNKTHERYNKTHQDLAVAQDSIGRLLRNARPDNRRNAKYAEPAPAAALAAFHTLHLRGRVTNTKGKPVRQATIEVLGARVVSDNKGRYELHLVLPPQYWSNSPEVSIKKEYYKDATQILDLDKDQLEWNPVLVSKN